MSCWFCCSVSCRWINLFTFTNTWSRQSAPDDIVNRFYYILFMKNSFCFNILAAERLLYVRGENRKGNRSKFTFYPLVKQKKSLIKPPTCCWDPPTAPLLSLQPLQAVKENKLHKPEAVWIYLLPCFIKVSVSCPSVRTLPSSVLSPLQSLWCTLFLQVLKKQLKPAQTNAEGWKSLIIKKRLFLCSKILFFFFIPRE